MADENNKVKAVWIGPPGHVLLDGTELIPGVTVAEVGEFELESDNWKRATKAQASKADAPEGDD